VSLREFRRAVVARISDDTRVGTVGSGSTTTVVQLGAGEAAAWAVGDVGYFNGGNLNAVRTVTAVDTVLDKVTVSPALTAAPVAGEKLQGGTREWLRYESSSKPGIYEWGYEYSPGVSPVEALKNAAGEQRAVAMFGMGPVDRDRFYSERLRMELHLFDKNVEFLEGLLSRLATILHRRRAALTVTGHDVWELTFETLPVFRSNDRMRSAICNVGAALARKVA
jgi:hypothetical protein